MIALTEELLATAKQAEATQHDSDVHFDGTSESKLVSSASYCTILCSNLASFIFSSWV